MDLDAIAVFVKVVQAGSFTKAAQLLKMPGSTVSAKVLSLEKSLGVTLLQRTTRKLHVTQAGDVYFKRCVRALEELQVAETEVTSGHETPQGTLRITAPMDAGCSFLPQLVAAFIKKYPDMKVDLMVTNRVVDLVAEGVDLGIRAGGVENSSLIVQRMFRGHIELWASPQYLKKHGKPSHPKDLSKHQYIKSTVVEEAICTLTNGKETAQIANDGSISADDFAVIKAFVLMGQGIGLIPRFFCDDEARKGKIVKVLPAWYWNADDFSFVYPAQRFVSPKVQAFLSLASDWLKPLSE